MLEAIESQSQAKRIVRIGWIVSNFLASPMLLASTPPPHAGWEIVPSAANLVDSGYWDTLYTDTDASITVSNGSLVAVAGNSGYLGGVNYYAPQLKLGGAFGIVVMMNVSAGGSAWVELAGSLSTGPSYWNNEKLVAVGLGPGYVSSYWTDGSSQNAGGSTGWSAGPFSGPVAVELLHVGSQFSVSVNNTLLGQVPDMGLLSSDDAYFGINVAPGTQLTITGWAVETPQGQSGNVQVVWPAATLGGLRSDVFRRGRLFACNPWPSEVALGSQSYSPTGQVDASMRQTVATDFNSLMNTWLIYALTEPAQGQYNYSNIAAARFLTDFAAANRMSMFAEALIPNAGGAGDSQAPSWLATQTFTRDELITIMTNHINAVMTPLKGSVTIWDVVQEIFDGQGNVSAGDVWASTIGYPDFIDLAFQTAHQIDPDAKLVYNDYAAENAGPKADAIYNLVSGMLARGVPIDGVAMEAHFSANGTNSVLPNVTQVEENMKRLGGLGLFVMVSEMDVRVPLPPSSQDLQAQANAWTDMATACAASVNCAYFGTQNLDDADSWINGTYPGFGLATMFDVNFVPKPVYFAVRQIFGGLDVGSHSPIGSRSPK
jgi:GH35 family endo-1,4-beta-xylanase